MMCITQNGTCRQKIQIDGQFVSEFKHLGSLSDFISQDGYRKKEIQFNSQQNSIGKEDIHGQEKTVHSLFR